MQVLHCVIFDLTGTAACDEDFILRLWQGHHQRYLWKNGSQTRWAPSLRTHTLICLATNMIRFFFHRGSVGCVFGGDKWFCTPGNTQILPVWETDLCCSVRADGAHWKRPVQDRWLCSSTDHPDHHQSPECPSRLDSHLFQLLSDEAGVQTQGTVTSPLTLQPKYYNAQQRRAAAISGRCRLPAHILQRCQVTERLVLCIFSQYCY